MNIRKGLLFTAVLLLVAVTAATAIVIPRDTVIPVTLDNTLSSATVRVGDTFSARHFGASGAGLPDGTAFLGRVTSVTRASSSFPGQIDIEFVSATLPDGTRIPLRGELSSLDSRSVRLDSSGRLVATEDARKSTNKFIAYGAGAGLLIGELLADKPLIGAIIGAAAGYLYGQKQGKGAVGKDVVVPAGTEFGVLLMQDVNFVSSGVPGPIGSGPAIGQGWRIRFDSVRPVMSGNIVLVPFSYVMDQIDMPFNYVSSSRMIRVFKGNSELVHTLGSNIAYVDGRAIRLGARSRIINGASYVPTRFVELLTDRSVFYNSRNGVLRIR